MLMDRGVSRSAKGSFGTLRFFYGKTFNPQPIYLPFLLQYIFLSMIVKGMYGSLGCNKWRAIG
jgi:hypothetical protein